MEAGKSTFKTYRNSISVNRLLSKNDSFKKQTSIKRISTNEYNKRKSTLKSITQIQFPEKSLSNLDFIKEKDPLHKEKEYSDIDDKTLLLLKENRHKNRPKGVRFRDRISIETQESIETIKQNILIDITNDKKIQMLHKIVKNKQSNLPMTSRKRTPQNLKLAADLMNQSVLSRNSLIQELKCFMCHYPKENSVLFGKKVIMQAKQRLHQVSEVSAQQGTFFRYEAFGYFLKILNDMNYDSSVVISAFETVLTKYTYPTAIKLMLYYTGSFLYQLNNLYDRSQEILRKMCDEILKLQLYEYMGIYLILMAKHKANLLEWDLCSRYLMKLLAYAWLYKFDNLEIWVYFQLSRSFFFMNQNEKSEYFKIRSQMSIIEPTTSIYRQLIEKDFTQELIYMRKEHKAFNLDRKILTCELIKVPSQPSVLNKERDDFKLQAQIKSINEHCKIKHVKNLLSRMNSSQEAQTSRNLTQCRYSSSKSSQNFAGNPILRTHESGLKNLKIYFRSNPKGQSLNNKNLDRKLYTFENSNKNILVIREMCRNILLQMKIYLPISLNINEN